MTLPLILPPRPALRPWLHHLMVMGYAAASASPIPAVLCPNIIVFPRGHGALAGPDGHITPLPRACLKGPCLAPRTVHCSAGSRFVSLLFRAGGMADALGPAVHEYRDQVIPLDALLPPGAVATMLARLDETDDPQAWADLVQDLVLAALRPPRVRAPGPAPLAGLFRPLAELAAAHRVSARQLERRLDHAYGANLRALRQMVRFGYCFARLTTAPVGPGALAGIAQDFGYYDQSHMDRDFRRLAGAPPRAILTAAAGDDPDLWLYRLGRRDFRQLFLADEVDSVQAALTGAA